MPKIIENLRARLLTEAKKQVREKGYGALTMRSVAFACGVGVGTLYNYFPSKEMLIASFMLEDWNKTRQKMRQAGDGADARTILSAQYDGIRAFCEQHERLFSDPAAIRVFSDMPHDRHDRLRTQLSEPLRRALTDAGRPNAEFLADFLAEALLTWTLAKKDKAELFSVLEPLL